MFYLHFVLGWKRTKILFTFVIPLNFGPLICPKIDLAAKKSLKQRWPGASTFIYLSHELDADVDLSPNVKEILSVGIIWVSTRMI